MIDYKKILIIRLSSLGDILLTTPVVKELKEKHPSVEIDFLVKPQFADVLKSNSNINKIYHYDKTINYNVLIKTLTGNKYDYVVDLQNNFRSRSISRKLQTKITRFKKPTLKKFLLVNFKWNRFKEIKTIPQMYSEAIEGLEFNVAAPQLQIPDDIVSSVKPELKCIGFAPGSKHFSKMWPMEYYIELGKKLSSKKYTILLFGGLEDKELCRQISDEIPDSIDLSTENDLLQLGKDMQQCEYIVCNDSGLMHTAVSVGAPVAAIFGATVREFGFYPYSIKSFVIENNGLKCRPCSHIGKAKCPKKHFKCMLDLTPELVYNELIKFQKLL